MFVEYQIKEFIFFNIFFYWFVCVLFFGFDNIPGMSRKSKKNTVWTHFVLRSTQITHFLPFLSPWDNSCVHCPNRLEFILQKWLFRLEPFVPSHWSRSLHILFGYHPHIYSLVSTTHSFGLTVLKAPWTHRVPRINF